MCQAAKGAYMHRYSFEILGGLHVVKRTHRLSTHGSKYNICHVLTNKNPHVIISLQ